MFARPTLPLLVFTDLDGTLLDHDDYGFEPALPALHRLAAAQVPLVILGLILTVLTIAGLRVGKAALLYQEVRHDAREGRLSK